MAWTLTNPVSRTALLVAKWMGAVTVLGVVAVFLPLGLRIAIATVAYGSLPDVPVILGFGVLYLVGPACYVALNLASGTVLSSAAGVAGIGFLVMLLPALLGPVLPVVATISPTAVHSWAYALAIGGDVLWMVPVVTVIAIAVLGIGAKVALEQQEL